VRSEQIDNDDIITPEDCQEDDELFEKYYKYEYFRPVLPEEFEILKEIISIKINYGKIETNFREIN